MKSRVLIALLIAVLLLAACAQDNDPAATVENYLRAKVGSDANTLRGLSCAAWEGQAVVEASSFESMNAQLDGMECERSGENGGYTIVECQGRIVTTYNGETREWDLGAFPYRLVQEGGEWKMCGYADNEATDSGG